MGLQLYNVSPRIPDEIKFLETLADNIWWCWNKNAIDLFVRIDPALWRQLSGTAKEFLRKVPQARLEELAHDALYLSQLKAVKSDFERETDGVLDFAKRSTAYFSLEFGIHESIRIFSGGLGVLAGDHLKAASDLKLPLVAVGLLYRQGYFRQVLDRTGWQIERYPIAEIQDLPMVRARNEKGEEVTISIPLVDRELFAAVWVLKVGNIPLVLLDTEVPQNPPDLREVSWRLYGGDKRMRLHQELLLGIGGVKALLALGCDPAVCHMNEGHAGFLSLARIGHLVNDCGYDPNVALEIVWRSNVFTTHTPVPAGNEVFDINLVRPYLARFAAAAKFDINRVIDWGIPINDRGRSGEMSMTVFGLRMAANYSNGVSKLHGEVAREMWKHLWPGRSVAEIPIRHITNGVHVASWISQRHWELFDQYLCPQWASNPDEALLREGMARIPDETLWTVHELCRQALIRRVRRFAESNFTYVLDGTENKHTSLRPDVLTIGFARRFATYKRGTLLLRDSKRLLALLRNTDRPIQFIFAGKAHPADDGGKHLIQDLIQFAQREKVQDKLVFLENYDIGMARSLVQGVDVWLNTPRRPQEASGTSGMKAAVNGVINCSILDGWWAEACDGKNGWAIGSSEDYTDDEDRDVYESQQLFNLLENEIIPRFYDRVGGDMPRRWVEMMRESIITGLAKFSSTRMVQDYNREFYKPATKAYRELVSDNAAKAHKLVAAKIALKKNFADEHRVSIEQPIVTGSLENLHVGDSFELQVKVSLGDLKPEDVEVDAYCGRVDAHNEIIESSSKAMKLLDSFGNGNYLYGVQISCSFAGRFGVTARVKAAGDEWDNSVPGFMCWPK
ncbi:MAG: alpha-glucan family phosphorylase [Victivallaceae bacterium]|nr:alpha-glucan family phosphorylase [Victivallaceae bacterium]